MIAENTRRLVGGLFEYHELGRAALKGCRHRCRFRRCSARAILRAGSKRINQAPHSPGGPRRSDELLLRRWGQAKSGEGSVVLLAGEPGIGKSRVAQTIVQLLSDEPHTQLRLFCSPHRQESALSPFISQIERAAGFQNTDTDEQRLAKLEATLAQQLTPSANAVPLVADLLSIPTGRSLSASSP